MPWTQQKAFPYKKVNFYKLLGVAANADLSTLKKAYKTERLKYHPDKNPSADAAARFINITRAYAALSDAEKRKEYDADPDNFINREFDSSITPAIAHSKLDEFFKLLIEKRGNFIPLSSEVFLRESNIPPEKSTKFFNALKNLVGASSTNDYTLVNEIPYASWHYLKIEITDPPNDEVDLREFYALLNDPLFFSMLSIEFWQANGDEKKTQVYLNIHLHDANQLDQAIHQLRTENSLLSLEREIKMRLAKNNKDTFALAAQRLLEDTLKSKNSDLITTQTATKIFFQTKETLISPIETNITSMKNIMTLNQQGKPNWLKIIGGSLIAFIGIASLIAGAVLLASLNVPGAALAFYLGIGLIIGGVGLVGTGLAITHQGQAKGLAKSLGGFISEASKRSTAADKTEILPTHNFTQPLKPKLLLTY